MVVGDGHGDLRGRLRYGDLAEALHAEGLALHNLASLPHISVAGSVATATHGSGRQPRDGGRGARARDVRRRARDRARAAIRTSTAWWSSLGALGAVTRVTLDVEPAYEIAQRVFEGLPWEAVPDVFAAGDSVSVFTRWDERAG